MKILCVYLLFTVLYLVCLDTTKSQPCPDAANWYRLEELIPTWYECGLNFKNLESTQSRNNKTLHFANLGEFPSLVAVRTEMNFTDKYGKASWTYQMCNGVLITKQHVLTAAHCLQEPPVPRYNLTDRLIRVTIGDYKTEITSDCVTTEYNTTCAPPAYPAFVSKVIPHEHFNRFSLHHDIAILELTAPVTFTDYVQPMCIPYGCGLDYTVKHYPQETLVQVGWKIYWPNKNRNLAPTTLQKIERAVIEPWHLGYGCDDAYTWLDNNTQICAHMYPSDPQEQVNCDAYTGGPLVLESLYQQIVFAIASYGETCRLGRYFQTGDPLVMTWVPAYVRWILKTLYFLKYNEPYPYKFVDIKWSSGFEGD